MGTFVIHYVPKGQNILLITSDPALQAEHKWIYLNMNTEHLNDLILGKQENIQIKISVTPIVRRVERTTAPEIKST